MLIWYKLGAAALIVAALWGYWSWSNNKIEDLVKANTLLEVKLSEKAEEVRNLEDTRKKQDDSITVLIANNQKYEAELKRYMSIFKRHNLHLLADAKPGLIEKRANTATEKLFKEMTNETTVNAPN